MEVAGTMWFFRKIVEGRETTRHFWTKQTLEKYLRTLPNKIIKREVLANAQADARQGSSHKTIIRWG